MVIKNGFLLNPKTLRFRPSSHALFNELKNSIKISGCFLNNRLNP